MNILMISYWDFQRYGMQVTRKTPCYFAAAGHNAVFLVHPEMTSKPDMRFFLHENLEVHRCRLPLGNCLKSQRILWRLWVFFYFSAFCIKKTWLLSRKGWQPDIIYAAEADAVIVGSLLKIYFKVPFVTRFYGVSRITDNVDFTKKKTGHMRLRHVVSRLALSRNADLCVMTDDGSFGKDVARMFNPKNTNILFLRNGLDQVVVDKARVQKVRSRLKIEDEDYILLSLCRLDQMKRVDRTILVLSKLVKQNKPVKLLIVGHGQLLPRLERMVETLGLKDHCIFIGPIAHQDIYIYYKLANCFLSLYEITNIGNPLLEALWAGKPVVTINVGDTEKIIKDGINGWLCPNAGEEEIIKCIVNRVIRMIENAELQAAIEKGATDYAKHHLLSWFERLEIELNAIEKLISY